MGAPRARRSGAAARCPPRRADVSPRRRGARLQAKTNVGVTDLFQTMVREILARDPNAGSGSGGGAVLGAGKEDPSAAPAKKKKVCTLL